MRLHILPLRLAVCRLDPDAPIPSWANGAFTSITRTADELSIVCDEDSVPADARAVRGRRVIVIEGPIPFEETGIAAALLTPLAEAKISVLLISTYDTDYLLVQDESFERACDVLRAAGHVVS